MFKMTFKSILKKDKTTTTAITNHEKNYKTIGLLDYMVITLFSTNIKLIQ